MIELNLDPDKDTLRKFGFIGFIGFGLFGLMAWYNAFLFSFGLGGARIPVTWVFGGLAAYCLVAGLLYPGANKPVFQGLSIITFPIGIVLSYVIMGFLFFVVFTLIGLMLRIFRYDPMNRTLDEKTDTYWSKARPSRPKEDYFKQY